MHQKQVGATEMGIIDPLETSRWGRTTMEITTVETEPEEQLFYVCVCVACIVIFRQKRVVYI